MSIWKICEIVGRPDQDVGSGIYIFLYNLDDGSYVIMGFITTEKVYYVFHCKNTENGEREIIERIVETNIQ
jgi:hypothetical protein